MNDPAGTCTISGHASQSRKAVERMLPWLSPTAARAALEPNNKPVRAPIGASVRIAKGVVCYGLNFTTTASKP